MTPCVSFYGLLAVADLYVSSDSGNQLLTPTISVLRGGPHCAIPFVQNIDCRRASSHGGCSAPFHSWLINDDIRDDDIVLMARLVLPEQERPTMLGNHTTHRSWLCQWKLPSEACDSLVGKTKRLFGTVDDRATGDVSGSDQAQLLSTNEKTKRGLALSGVAGVTFHLQEEVRRTKLLLFPKSSVSYLSKADADGN